MGLSSFNRMRRERAPVNIMEAERSRLDNEARNARRNDRVAVHDRNKQRVEEIRQEDAAANERIGEKVRKGMQTAIIDEPLRKDHAAEIAGRHLEGVQEPKDPVDRVRERIPQHETANEKLVENMSAELPGPDLAAVAAAREEAGAAPLPETRAEPAEDAPKRRPGRPRKNPE